MSIVYSTDKRSGITYAYESQSCWDKEKSSRIQKGHLLEGVIRKLVKSFKLTVAVKRTALIKPLS